MIRYISILLLLAVSSGLYAQKQSVIPAKTGTQNQDSSLKAKYSSTHKTDTIRKPRILRQWTLSQDYSEEIPIQIDTVFSLTDRFKLADKYSPINATLGNYGLPFYQLSFFDRITDPDKFLYAYYYPLMHLPSNTVFMNTQVPYTELDWSFGGPVANSEQTFRVRYSQNINRFINFGLIYDIVFSLGLYNYQRSSDKTFTFYSSYTGDKYKLYFSAGVNNLISYENGGVQKIADLNQANTLDVQTNLGALEVASSTLKNRNLLLVQRYKIGGNPAVKRDSTSHKRPGFFGLSGTFS